jgi:hypothetical protein
MSSVERMAADISYGTPYARATVTAHEVIEIPSAERGKFWHFHAETSDVWIRFGTSASVEVDPSARSTLNTATLSASGKEAHLHVAAGATEPVRLDKAWTHFAHESADTSGVLRFGPAQGSFGAEG